ncbi:MAG: FIST signal transduction protein [Oceanococcus sp.]
MLKVCVAHSNDPDTLSAVSDIKQQCQESLGASKPTAGLLFAAIDFEHQILLDEICDAWPELALIGCTTDGEVSSVLEFQQDSVTLMLFCTDDDIHIGAGIGPKASQDSLASTHAAIAQAKSGACEPIRLCLTLPESLTADSKSILDGLRNALPDNIPIVGGLAADRWQFEKTFQFCGRNIYSDAVPVLLFSGNLRCSHGVASGWRPIGNPGVVTHAKDNVVYRIDDESALDYYRSYLGEHTPSSNYPLAVFTDEEQFYLRAPSGEYCEEEGSVSFFADVPQGAKVQMSESSRDDILAATQASMRQAIEAYGDEEPAAALFFSCASRRQLLGTRTREEFALASACARTELPICGFYTNGEISPMSLGSTTQFHNETFISLLIGPNEPSPATNKS